MKWNGIHWNGLPSVSRKSFFNGSSGKKKKKNLPAMQETQEMWVQTTSRSPGEENGNPLQNFGLENSMD